MFNFVSFLFNVLDRRDWTVIMTAHYQETDEIHTRVYWVCPGSRMRAMKAAELLNQAEKRKPFIPTVKAHFEAKAVKDLLKEGFTLDQMGYWN